MLKCFIFSPSSSLVVLIVLSDDVLASYQEQYTQQRDCRYMFCYVDYCNHLCLLQSSLPAAIISACCNHLCLLQSSLPSAIISAYCNHLCLLQSSLLTAIISSLSRQFAISFKWHSNTLLKEHLSYQTQKTSE